MENAQSLGHAGSFLALANCQHCTAERERERKVVSRVRSSKQGQWRWHDRAERVYMAEPSTTMHRLISSQYFNRDSALDPLYAELLPQRIESNARSFSLLGQAGWLAKGEPWGLRRERRAGKKCQRMSISKALLLAFSSYSSPRQKFGLFAFFNFYNLIGPWGIECPRFVMSIQRERSLLCSPPPTNFCLDKFQSYNCDDVSFFL